MEPLRHFALAVWISEWFDFPPSPVRPFGTVATASGATIGPRISLAPPNERRADWPHLRCSDRPGRRPRFGDLDGKHTAKWDLLWSSKAWLGWWSCVLLYAWVSSFMIVL
ncbi:hypothetical protein QBC33DRAFT_564252 [Phialemonium atrogriseum]|uniref:Uncharacterized protein n=1 Tax=Phialemonium atrogriseum TaxID=1093897 RepID=A0AAJ0FIA9_9PEZI|nr:uncharacterized protein QBC33DRAFT_564252 [Phialemonium atrogriseum]KAK1761925.1 hypothetical protein QBC33DRAFT_564252 [Phialemonium atrogriseum]